MLKLCNELEQIRTRLDGKIHMWDTWPNVVSIRIIWKMLQHTESSHRDLQYNKIMEIYVSTSNQKTVISYSITSYFPLQLGACTHTSLQLCTNIISCISSLQSEPRCIWVYQSKFSSLIETFPLMLSCNSPSQNSLMNMIFFFYVFRRNEEATCWNRLRRFDKWIKSNRIILDRFLNCKFLFSEIMYYQCKAYLLSACRFEVWEDRDDTGASCRLPG